jgi:hypothetical protein
MESYYEYMLRRLKENMEKEEDNSSPIDPKHYNTWKIEPITFIMENDLGFCEGNIIKYIMRWQMKNGITDLKKARQYIDFIIKKEEEQK